MCSAVTGELGRGGRDGPSRTDSRLENGLAQCCLGLTTPRARHRPGRRDGERVTAIAGVKDCAEARRCLTYIADHFAQANQSIVQDCFEQVDVGMDIDGLPEHAAVIPGPRSQREVCFPMLDLEPCSVLVKNESVLLHSSAVDLRKNRS